MPYASAKLSLTQPTPPMPRGIAPMLAVLSDDVPGGNEWSFEYKWDGVRAITSWDGRKLRIESRNRLDITARYPELHPLADALGRHAAILDGEIVALDDAGRPSFGRLQHRMHVVGSQRISGRAREVPAYYILFDLLYYGTSSTMDKCLAERRELLGRLKLAAQAWRVSPASIGEGQAMLHSAREHQMEGVVAKRLDSLYRPGRRSPDWLKIKLVRRQEFVVGGWMPQAGDATRVGSLLVGYYDAGKLRYAGRVGSGFSDEIHRELLQVLAAKQADHCPFSDRPEVSSTVRFVRPESVVEVEYRRWPAGALVQQAAFKGLRFDKDAREVVKET